MEIRILSDANFFSIPINRLRHSKIAQRSILFYRQSFQRREQSVFHIIFSPIAKYFNLYFTLDLFCFCTFLTNTFCFSFQHKLNERISFQFEKKSFLHKNKKISRNLENSRFKLVNTNLFSNVSQCLKMKCFAEVMFIPQNEIKKFSCLRVIEIESSFKSPHVRYSQNSLHIDSDVVFFMNEQ